MKSILLKENGLGRYDDVSPFPLGDLTLKITGVPIYLSGEFRLILHLNSFKLGSYTIYPKGENVITIPQNKLSAGRLSSYVAFYQSGHEVKRYLIEDLIITALNDSLTAYPEIAKIVADVALLSNTVTLNKQSADGDYKKLADSVTLLSKTVAELQKAYNRERQKVLALLKFAWTDFVNNVYIDGDTFEDFIKKFGFDLTAEEIKFIKGGDL